MDRKYKKIFDRIISRIAEEKRIIAVKRILAASIALMACSVAAFIPAFNAARAGLYETGFINFFSLLFSDFRVVVSYWQSFFLSLLETFPALEIAVVLFVSLVFFISVNFIVKSAQFMLNPSKLIIN